MLRRVPLRLKLFASTASVLVLMSTFFFVYYPARQQTAALDAMRREASALARMVALGAGAGIERNDYGAVTAALGWAKGDSALAYMVATDSSGEAFATYNPKHIQIRPTAADSVGTVRQLDGIVETARGSRRHAVHSALTVPSVLAVLGVVNRDGGHAVGVSLCGLMQKSVCHSSF